MADDYFSKLNKQTQPIRDAFSKRPAAPKPAAAPKAPEAPKGVPAGQLQGGESLEDWTYMQDAQKRINQKLAPKSIMGKSSPKR